MSTARRVLVGLIVVVAVLHFAAATLAVRAAGAARETQARRPWADRGLASKARIWRGP